MAGMDLSEKLGIQMNDQLSTHFPRALRSLNRSVNVQKPKNIANNKELEKRYQDLQKLEKEASIQTRKFKRVFAKGKDMEQPFKKLKSIESQYSSLLSGVKQLQDKSTGEVAMPSLKPADQLIEWSSLAALPTVDRISEALPHLH
ncbi:hypothetical protein M422DRAFT_247551 [Sphaerobolus stellatus SS14]|nr:hypothetical protein M422DRAFT_247551 [Sphaerobolus stellatus SS14]